MSGPGTCPAVMVGVDGSPSSDAALRWAAREAVMRNVPLVLVHVATLVAPPPTLAWPVAPMPDELITAQKKQARKILAEAIEMVSADAEDGRRPDIKSELHFGGPVPTLVDLSKEAGLVVVGCRGTSRLRSALLGSVSSGLIHHAHCPVAIVHDRCEGAQGERSAAEHLPVLVAIDGSRASEVPTAVAFDEASWRGVDLVALHVWTDQEMPGDLGMEWAGLQSAAEKELAERLAGWQERYPDVGVHRVVEFEQPAKQILDHSRRAQLVVLGSHGRGGFAGLLLGSVGRAVTQAAGIPVIVARQR